MPQNLAEGRARLETLKAEIMDIESQLGSRRQHTGDRDAKAWDWRQRTKQALSIKQCQIRLLRDWIKINQGQAERSTTTLLIDLFRMVGNWVEEYELSEIEDSEQLLIEEVRAKIAPILAKAAAVTKSEGVAA